MKKIKWLVPTLLLVGVNPIISLTGCKKAVEPTDITIDHESCQLAIGDQIQLTASINPQDANQAVVWSSSEESVATVDENGKVTAVSNGLAEINARPKDNQEIVATCYVVVDDSQFIWIPPSQFSNYATIYGYRGDVPENLTIPGTYSFYGEDYPVCIGERAFSNTNIKNLTLQEGIIEIGDSSFANCLQLHNLVLPNSLKTIDSYAFQYDTGIETINIPANVDYISSLNPWDFCNLDAITVDPENETLYISDDQNCILFNNSLISACNATDLEDEIFEEHEIHYISNTAFRGLTDIEEIYIPATVENVDGGFCVGCESASIRLEYVDPQNQIFKLEDGCLLKKLSTDPETYTVVGSLNGTIPDDEDVVAIDGGAYAYDKSITTVDLPANIQSMGYNPFLGCQNLEYISVHSDNEFYYSIYGCNCIMKRAVPEAGQTEDELVVGCAGTVIPYWSVDTIKLGHNCFTGIKFIEPLLLPDNISSIGDGFDLCHVERINYDGLSLSWLLSADILWHINVPCKTVVYCLWDDVSFIYDPWSPFFE